jgi:hypothetical protein
MSVETSPPIKAMRWGAVTVGGYEAPFKDVKLFPGGAREWDWIETGTQHTPGIQAADVQELLDHGAGEVILGTGYYERLGVRDETLALLEAAGVKVHIAQSEKAMRLYNELREETAVGALIHSTC